ncbi:hypothetical protein [Streptomyces sp. NPDC046985]|uniref:hypothetical protein n=1 Tax=Streptomyces sp. NPDC046985 TaxID=3155377 RepID=UPI0033FE4E80
MTSMPSSGITPALRLRSDLLRLSRTASHFRAPVASPSDRAAVRRLLAPWLPIAVAHRHNARGSVSDESRWSSLIAAAEDPDLDAPYPGDAHALYSRAQDLLQALLEATRPGPVARQLAQGLRQSIVSGEYPPGSLLPMSHVAADAGVAAASLVRVELAARDLQLEGRVTVDSRKRIRVGESTTDRPTLVADWLSVLIEQGAYRPPAPLPRARPLARTVRASPDEIALALRLLSERHVVHLQRGARPLLRAEHPLCTAQPPSLSTLLRQVELRADDLSGAAAQHQREVDARRNCQWVLLWWRRRRTPPAAELHSTLASVLAAAKVLIARGADHDADTTSAHLVRVTAITAAAAVPADLDAQLWRAACLSTAVLDCLSTAEARDRSA